MDKRTTFAKTPEGWEATRADPGGLTLESRRVLQIIQGPLNFAELHQLLPEYTAGKLLEQLKLLDARGYLREFVEPLPDFTEEFDDEAQVNEEQEFSLTPPPSNATEAAAEKLKVYKRPRKEHAGERANKHEPAQIALDQDSQLMLGEMGPSIMQLPVPRKRARADKRKISEGVRKSDAEIAQMTPEERVAHEQSEHARRKAVVARIREEALEKYRRELAEREQREADMALQREREAQERLQQEAREQAAAEEAARLAELRRNELEVARLAALRERLEKEERSRQEAAERARLEAERLAQLEQERRIALEQEQQRLEQERRIAQEQRQREQEEQARLEAERQAEIEAEFAALLESDEDRKRKAWEAVERKVKEMQGNTSQGTDAAGNGSTLVSELPVSQVGVTTPVVPIVSAADAREAELPLVHEQQARREPQLDLIDTLVASEDTVLESDERAPAELGHEHTAGIIPTSGMPVGGTVGNTRREVSDEKPRFPTINARRWGRRIIGVGIVLALAAGLLAFVINSLLGFDQRKAALTEALKVDLGQPVSVGDMSLQWLPQPGWRLENVVIGEDRRLVAPKVALSLSLPDLIEGRLRFSDVEIEQASVKPGALNSLLLDHFQDKVKIAHLVLKDALVSDVGADDLHFNARVDFDAEGNWKKASADATALHLHLGLIHDGVTARLSVDGDDLPLPFGDKLSFGKFSALGSVNQNGMTLTHFDASALHGNVAGNASLKWGKTWVLQSTFNGRHLAANLLADRLFEMGTIDGDVTFNSSSNNFGGLLNAPHVRARFVAVEGALLGVDLGNQFRDAGAGGRTAFSELRGGLAIDGKTISLHDLRLKAGAMTAAGQLNISADRHLSGGAAIDIRTTSNTMHADLIISGTAQHPEFSQ